MSVAIAPAPKERVRASKLRRRKNDGKPLKPEEEHWLSAYEQQRARSTLRAVRMLPPASSPSNSNAPRRSHRTVPVTQRFDPSASTWTPKVPPRAANAEPLQAGEPQPPPEGTPLVDNSAPASASDAAAAQQIAQLVVFFVTMGIGAGRELAADMELPAELRGILMTDEVAGGLLTTVHGATMRLALKYGVGAVPMADELTVAAALVGSGMLVVRNFKRKQLGSNAKKPEAPPASSPARNEPPAAPKSDIDSLWGPGPVLS